MASVSTYLDWCRIGLWLIGHVLAVGLTDLVMVELYLLESLWLVLSSLPFSLSHRTKRKVWNISSSNGECVSAWWISQSDSRQATDWIIILTNSSNRPLHGIRHRKIRSSQCACRGQKVNSIPLNCVLTREFLVKTKPTCCVVDCENRTSSVTASY